MSLIQLPIAELKPALIGLGKVIGRKQTLPILGQVKIERTSEGWTALTVTNLDHTVTVRLEQPSEGEPGAVLIPFEELTNTVNACGKSDHIQIESQAILRYSISSQRIESPIETLPVEEFPATPKVNAEAIPLPDTLRESIHQALACASDDPTRYILAGAFFDVSKKDCHQVVGTNGRQLYASNSFSLPLKQSLLIPGSKFLDWKEFSNDGAWQLKVEQKGDERSEVQISSRRWRYITKQIEGNFPNWLQVLPDPANARTTLEIHPEALEAVAQTITRLPCHDQINFTVGLELADGKVNVMGIAPDDAEWSKVEIKEVQARGKDVAIFVNRQFLGNALRFGLNKIEIIDGLSALRISRDGRQMIIMPVRTAISDAAKAAPVPAENINPPPPIEVDQPNKEPMSDTNQNPTTTTVERPALETAQAQLDLLRGELRSLLVGINKLAEVLKLAQRENKASEKEVSSVRATLRSLQTVRI